MRVLSEMRRDVTSTRRLTINPRVAMFYAVLWLLYSKKHSLHVIAKANWSLTIIYIYIECIVLRTLQ